VPRLVFSPSKLRSLRDSAGLSRDAVGYSVNRSAQMIWWYEAGRATPPVVVICALADVLDCSLADLFEEANSRV
jgi:transcriptional regulator with XRE-family HTH domain